VANGESPVCSRSSSYSQSLLYSNKFTNEVRRRGGGGLFDGAYKMTHNNERVAYTRPMKHKQSATSC
jgi:hypothetical protein